MTDADNGVMPENCPSCKSDAGSTTRSGGEGVRVTFGPCTHEWSYGPTTGGVSCIRCREARGYDSDEAIDARRRYERATTPSPDSGEIEADRDYLHDLITKVGVYSEHEDECLPLTIVDESDPSAGHVGEVRLYLPAGYQIVRTTR